MEILVSTSNTYFSRSEEISLGNQRVCVTYTRKNIKKECSGLGLISLLALSCQYILQPSSICHSFFLPYVIEKLLQKVQSAYCIYLLFAVYASAHDFLAFEPQLLAQIILVKASCDLSNPKKRIYLCSLILLSNYL